MSNSLQALSYCSWGSWGKNTGVVCHFLLQGTTFCQKSSLWPTHLGWPCTSWFIASLSYASPCTTTRLWFMKGGIANQHRLNQYMLGINFSLQGKTRWTLKGSKQTNPECRTLHRTIGLVSISQYQWVKMKRYCSNLKES